MMLNHRLAINPKYNMISNIGIDIETTHATADIRLMPVATQKLLYKKTFEYETPLKHPTVVLCDDRFKHKVDYALGHTMASFIWNHLEYYYRVLRYCGIKVFTKRIANKLK